MDSRLVFLRPLGLPTYFMSNWQKSEEQTHVHEFVGSTRLAELEEDPHNHRFAGVTGQAICVPGGHIHRINAATDFFDHFHLIKNENLRVSLPIPVGEGRHVHFVFGTTTLVDGHVHEFIFATLIEAPIFEEC